VPPDKFCAYAQQFSHMLKRDGKLLLVCYSDKDPYAQGKGSAKGTLGNEMYYRTYSEIEEAYAPLKVLSYRETTLGKQQHRGHYFVFGHESGTN
jgi:hypothetical protein